MGASNQPAVHRRLSTSPETVWLTEMVLSFAPLSKSQGPRRSARVIDRHASARHPAPATPALAMVRGWITAGGAKALLGYPVCV